MSSSVRHRSLRTGFSTGTAAAGAVTAALLALAENEAPASLEGPLPGTGSLLVPVHQQALLGSTGEGQIIKNAGDDPDVTHGAIIGARVRLLNGSAAAGEITFRRGEGVGLVTKPGLPVPPGEPAINPVPRKIIRQVAENWWPQLFPDRPLRLEVEIFAPQGEELARYTLNPRLGILGGISILGTTGLVKPFSHQAYRATIAAGFKVARAAGLSQVICSTGGKSEALAHSLLPGLPEEALVQMGDFVHFAIRLAGRLEFEKITVAAFFGKAMKIAQGFGHTHASQGEVDLALLAQWTKELTGNLALAAAITQANTARGALELLLAAGEHAVVARVGEEMLKTLKTLADRPVALEAFIFSSAGQLLWQGKCKYL
jgi:cobalt-precorrin-5B (C1)-methyltransferase